MQSAPTAVKITFVIGARRSCAPSGVGAGKVTYARFSPIVASQPTFERNRRVRKFLFAGYAIVATLACIGLTGCGTIPVEARSPDDPFEPMNRAVLDVNTSLDKAVIRPVAEF